MESKSVVALIIPLERVVRRLLRPARAGAKLIIGAVGDTTPTRSELIAENALLRQQGIVLRRNIQRPRLNREDRVLLLILARLSGRWRDALHVVSPETLLRWHRDLFKIVWRRTSRPRGQPKRLAPEIVTLVQAMAKDNVLWGVERIRGELLKVGIRVSKRNVQKYMRDVRPLGKRGQNWNTFIRNHRRDIWGATFCSSTMCSFAPSSHSSS